MIYAHGNRAEGHTIYHLIKMLSKGGGYNMLHGFTEYTGERIGL